MKIRQIFNNNVALVTRGGNEMIVYSRGISFRKKAGQSIEKEEIEKIYVLDPRYFRGRLFEFMEEYEPKGGMDVLVLYNCIHFLEDFAYVE